MMSTSQYSESEPMERFAVEVSSELSPEVMVRRGRQVNVLLRMSMLHGLEMELDSILNLLCDMAAEIVPYGQAAVHFWDEGGEGLRVRASRNLPDLDAENFARASKLSYAAAKLGRPLLVPRGGDSPSDALLDAVKAACVLVVPLFVQRRATGALQLFAAPGKSFSAEDAQLLWMLALVAESMLARDYSHQSLLRIALTDFLTGLKTRGFLERQMDLELARCQRRQTPLALLMIDIDDFKRINDDRGHAAGDLVLHGMGAILSSELRQIDIAARYGGDEFVLLLPETGARQARLVAQRLRAAVERTRFPMGAGNGEAHITISLGGALFPQEASGKQELLAAADAALYQAKARGRNRAVFYSEWRRRGEASCRQAS